MRRTTVLKIVLPFLVLLVGGALMAVLISSRQAPVKDVKEFAGAVVETVTVQRREHTVTVAATGTVQARQQTEIVAQVSGRVSFLADDFIAGGMFKKGDILFRLEDIDYRLAVQRAEADLAAAELELARVKGQARVARDEWQRLQVGKGEPNPLVLYEPQMKNAEGRVTAAKAALSQAGIDLQRTEVRAPFNCLVLSEGIDLGQYVRGGAAVGTLLGTNTAEIVVPLPLDALPWLNIPRGSGRGATATVRFNAGAVTYDWPGTLVRTLGEVDPLGRMARVVVSVDDPYLLRQAATDERPPLAVGSFVDLELQGKRLPAVTVLPRRALRDDDTVWVVDADSLLRIRPVQVLRREQESILVGDGLQDGEQVIVTALAGAADGLKVRVRKEDVGP
ncbi:MAG: efflux RND transporter periplasmic adaptor subunit [Syntrophotaleaceae bacterium]